MIRNLPSGSRFLPLVGLLLFGLAACEEDRTQILDDWKHPSPVIRAGAVQSLAQIGDEDAYRLLVKSLHDPSAVVRVSAVQALGDFPKRDTTTAVIQATRDADPEVRSAAVDVLSRKSGDMAQRALVRMLLFGESNTSVRAHVFQALESLGLSGERLSGEIAESQMAWIRENLGKVQGTALARLIRLAGRSVHPDGLDVVLRAMESQDMDVVLAALDVLDGQGGQRALKVLRLLVSDPVDEVRLAAIRAARRFGQEGLELLKMSLRDPEPKVRVAAVQAWAAADASPDPKLVCPMLTDRRESVALEVARLVSQKNLTCDPESVLEDLARATGHERLRLVRVLALLKGSKNQAALRALSSKLEGAERGWVLLALAGDAASAKDLDKEIRSLLQEQERLSEDWIGPEGLPPLRSTPESAEKSESPSVVDGGPSSAADEQETGAEKEIERKSGDGQKKRLSEAELSELLAKHKLPAATENTPRGLSDLLADFEPAVEHKPQRHLFQPVFQEDQDLLGALLAAAWKSDPHTFAPLLMRALALKEAGAQAAVCRHLLRGGVDNDLQLDEPALEGLVHLLEQGDSDQRVLVAKLAREIGERRLLAPIIAALGSSRWETRSELIQSLGRLGDATTLPALTRMLAGYSAIPAARAVAELGLSEGIDALRNALKHAGPAETQEIQLALARLGDQSVLPLALEALHASDPRIRQNAVEILAHLAGPEAVEALKSARFDLDRLVRRDAKRALEQGKTGDSRHGQYPQKEGRSGAPAPQR